MARKRKFYWYQAQLLFAAFLQFLAIFAPLSYAGNFSQHRTAFLHAFWVSEETVDFATRTTSLDLIWFFLRPELLVLVVWMTGMGFLLLWVLYSKTDWVHRRERLGKAMGGFAAQIILAYFVANSVTGHVGEPEAGGEVVFKFMPQFFLLLFPLIFCYMAWRRMKKIPDGEV